MLLYKLGSMDVITNAIAKVETVVPIEVTNSPRKKPTPQTKERHAPVRNPKPILGIIAKDTIPTHL